MSHVKTTKAWCDICRRLALDCTGTAEKVYVSIKPVAFLSQWKIVPIESESSKGQWVQLQGKVFNHRKYADGNFIVTSPVLKLNIPAGTAETMHTRYILEDQR